MSQITAQKTNTNSLITSKDLYDIQLLRGGFISPNGEKILYWLEEINSKTDKKSSHLYLVDLEAPTSARPLTFGESSNSGATWSPDGQSIAFLSNRKEEKQPQIYLLPMQGGEARPISDLKATIGKINFSPDGKKLLVAFRPKSKEQQEQAADPQKAKKGFTYHHYTNIHFKSDGEGYTHKTYWAIGIIDLATQAFEIIDEGIEKDCFYGNWSPDSSKVVFSSNRTEKPDENYGEEDLYIYDLATKKSHKINTPLGAVQMPVFSPNGKQIVYLGANGTGEWWRNNNLWLVKADGSEEVQNLTGHLDIDLNSLTLNDMAGLPDLDPPCWTSDGQKIIVQTSQKGTTSLVAYDLQNKTISPYLEQKGAIGPFNFDAKQETLAFRLSTMTDPGQVFIKKEGTIKQVTHVNGVLKEKDMGTIEEVWFDSTGDKPIQGWILKPPGFDPALKYPSILEIHGGPLLQYGESFMHEFYYLAAKGYVVYFSNPRGGKGYGEAHSKAIWNGWGTKDYEDLMAFADYMEQQAYIDTERMGVTGGSYGGYMTNWIIGHTNRFKAAVTQRCVSNLISMWGSSDGNWIFQQVFGNKAPFENMENFWKMSPIRYIGNCTTPTLVIHSEKDYRCCIEQGEQVYVALKRLNIDTEFVIFPDESHGLSRGGRIDRRIARLDFISGWFDKYL